MYPLYYTVNTRGDADIRQFALRLILQLPIATAISGTFYRNIRKFGLHFLQTNRIKSLLLQTLTEDKRENNRYLF